MTDEKKQPNAEDQPAQTKSVPLEQRVPQSHVTAATHSGQQAAPGRKPLFRNTAAGIHRA